MNNPKYREAYPGKHKVKNNGGKYLTTWSGYNLDLIQGPYGILSATNTRGYNGDQVTLLVTANNKYRLKDYTVTSATLNGDVLTFQNSDCSAKANFEKYIFDLKLQQTNGGTITGSPLTGQSGTTVSLSYTPSADYYFNGWLTTGGSVTNNTFKFGNSDATAKANFRIVGEGSNTAAAYRKSFTNSVTAAAANSTARYSSTTATGDHGNVYVYSTGINITGLSPVSTGNIYAWKTQFGSTYSTTANKMEVTYVNGFGNKAANANTNYVVISRNNTLIDYVSPGSSNGNILIVPHKNWYSGTKQFGYVCSVEGSAIFCSAFYDKQYVGKISARYATISSEDDILFGEYYQTSTGATGSVGMSTTHYSSYNPMPGSASFSMLSFDTVQNAIQWIRT